MTKVILSIETQDSLDIVPYVGKFIDGVKINHILWNELNFDVQEGKELFVDLKLWDTPNTVKTVIEQMISKGATMATICTHNNDEVFRELEQYHNSIKLLGVTYLTSWSATDQYEICREMPNQMWERSIKTILQAGFYGIVCSPSDIEDVKWKDIDEDLKRVCPGITLSNNKPSGQVRTSTPEEAKKLGADYIVVGRSITESKNPVKSAETIYEILRK